MAQQGFVFRRKGGGNWFLRYRDNFIVDGKLVRKQKCVKLADYGDRYRCASDLDDLVAETMSGVRQAAKCPHSSDSFESYVEEVYLPFVQRTMKPSTYSGYKTYWERYLKPRVEKYALRDFTVAIVSSLLDDVANAHSLKHRHSGEGSLHPFGHLHLFDGQRPLPRHLSIGQSSLARAHP